MAKLKQRPQRLLITILIGNNLVNIGASSLAAVIAYELIGGIGPAVATFVLTALILIFGEIGPKTLAQSKIEKIALAVVPIISFLSVLFKPVSIILERFNSRLLRIFTRGGKTPTVSSEELKSMAEIGAEEGVVKHKEKEMIKRVLEFGDIVAGDVMTLKSNIFSLPAGDTIDKALPKIIEAHHSRIPIYDKSIDNIVGIIFMPNVLKELARGGQEILLKNIAMEPYIIPKQRKIDDIFKDFQRQHRHMAIVVDEQGLTAGIITLEDLLEEIVGEIMDESDIDESLMKRLDNNTVLADADSEIREVNNFFNIKIPGKPQQLVSEIVLEKFGRIPKAGEEIKFSTFKIVVEKATPKKIEKVRIIKN